ncbi:hypothetical protein BC830DRAFT_624505 [Chytriomyces sp. MP71]|nr:hypothetical protein BC830DRAFT_624505 [Chytriomyces sp. MP71]
MGHREGSEESAGAGFHSQSMPTLAPGQRTHHSVGWLLAAGHGARIEWTSVGGWRGNRGDDAFVLGGVLFCATQSLPVFGHCQQRRMQYDNRRKTNSFSLTLLPVNMSVASASKRPSKLTQVLVHAYCWRQWGYPLRRPTFCPCGCILVEFSAIPVLT